MAKQNTAGAAATAHIPTIGEPSIDIDSSRVRDARDSLVDKIADLCPDSRTMRGICEAIDELCSSHVAEPVRILSAGSVRARCMGRLPLPDVRRGGNHASALEDRIARRLESVRALTATLSLATMNPDLDHNPLNTTEVCFLIEDLLDDAEASAGALGAIAKAAKAAKP
jgi:hypothetical protein